MHDYIIMIQKASTTEAFFIIQAQILINLLL